MSTNYYVIKNNGERLHLGKNSVGTDFLTTVQGAVYHTVKEWKNFLQSGEVKNVENEYGVIISVEEALKMFDGHDDYRKKKISQVRRDTRVFASYEAGENILGYPRK